MIAALLRLFAGPATPAPVAPSTAPFTDLSHYDGVAADQFRRLPRSLRRDILKFRKDRMTLRLGREIAITKGARA